MQNEYYIQIGTNLNKLDSSIPNYNTLLELYSQINNIQDDKAILKFVTVLNYMEKNNNSKKNLATLKDIKISLYLYIGSSTIYDYLLNYKEEINIPIETSLRQLNELIGLNDVKKAINKLFYYNQIQSIRQNKKLINPTNTLHLAFLGNPGTAKTTVARIVGRMYKHLGLLSKGHFIEASRTDLVAEYQGQTAIKVKNLINSAKGGVLFIDEAYSLTENDNSDSYGRECLTELTKALEDYRNDLVVIVAGYPTLMEKFFASNPGLSSRFNTWIKFEDYTIEELIDIFKYICKENDYIANGETISSVKNLLLESMKSDNFSNGRTVRNLFDKMIINQAERLIINNLPKTNENLVNLTIDDIPKI